MRWAWRSTQATKCITAGWQYAASLGAAIGTEFVLDSLTPTNSDGVMTLGSADGRSFRARGVVIAPGSWITGLAKYGNFDLLPIWHLSRIS